MIKLPKDKPIRLKTDKWQEVKDLADELSDELSMNVSLPDAISYLIKFYREHTAGTPGRKAAASMGGTQAQSKGVITD